MLRRNAPTGLLLVSQDFQESGGAGFERPKKVNLLVDTWRQLEYLAFPCKLGTSGYDCSVQFFDNRIACDGPNAIPSHPENGPVI